MLLNCDVGEDSWESLDCKEIKPVNPKGNQPWIFIVRTDAEAEAPILRPPDVKSWLIKKDPDAWKDWRQEEKGMTEDETVGWYYWFHGHEFKQAPGDGEGQRSLACCSSWGSQRAGHNWVTEEQQLSICLLIYYFHFIGSDIWLVCIQKKQNLTLSILYMTINHKVKLFMIISIRKV